MNYFEKQTLYFTMVCSDITNIPEEKVIDRIAPIFTCTEEETQKVKDLLNSQDFQRFRSVNAVSMRLNYIHSFCPDKNAFGLRPDEEEALLVKKSAYTLISELEKDPLSSMNLLSVLSRLYDSDNRFAFLYAAVLYCQEANKTAVISALRKAIREGNIDASIAMMYFANDTQKRAFFADMRRGNAAYIHQEIAERMATSYAHILSIDGHAEHTEGNYHAE